MARNNTPAAPEAPVLSDTYETVSTVWARGMADGEIVEGRYLGHDAIKNEEGQLRRRHRFELLDASKASPESIDGVEVIWGASGLDIQLHAASLGRMTEVTRVGRSPNTDMIIYRVRQRGAIDGRGVIDRDDAPVMDNSGDTTGSGGWRGRRARRS